MRFRVEFLVVALLVTVATARADDRVTLAVGVAEAQVQDTLVTATRYAGLVAAGGLGYRRTRDRWLLVAELGISGGTLHNRYGYEALDVAPTAGVAYARRIWPCLAASRWYAGAAFALAVDIHQLRSQDYTYAHWLTSYGLGPFVAGMRPLGRGELRARVGVGLVALASRRDGVPTYEHDRPEPGAVIRLIHRDLAPATAWSHRTARLDLEYVLPLGPRVFQRVGYRLDYAGDTEPTSLHHLSHTLTLAVSYAL